MAESGASFMTVGDVDKDGKPDVLVSNYTSNTISVFRNTSTTGVINSSTLASKVDFSLGTGGAYCIELADLDGDGKLDMAATQFGTKISIFRNTSTSGTISFAARQDFTTPNGTIGLRAADMDGGW